MNFQKIFENAADDIADYKTKRDDYYSYRDKSRELYDKHVNRLSDSDSITLNILGKTFEFKTSFWSSKWGGAEYYVNIAENGTHAIRCDHFTGDERSMNVITQALISYLASGHEATGQDAYGLMNDLKDNTFRQSKEAYKKAAQIIDAVADIYDELFNFLQSSYKKLETNHKQINNLGTAYNNRMIWGKGRAKSDAHFAAYNKARQSIYDEAPAIEAGSTVVYHGKSGDSIAEVIAIDEEAGKAKIKTERGANINVPLDMIEKSDVDYSAMN